MPRSYPSADKFGTWRITLSPRSRSLQLRYPSVTHLPSSRVALTLARRFQTVAEEFLLFIGKKKIYIYIEDEDDEKATLLRAVKGSPYFSLAFFLSSFSSECSKSRSLVSNRRLRRLSRSRQTSRNPISWWWRRWCWRPTNVEWCWWSVCGGGGGA